MRVTFILLALLVGACRDDRPPAPTQQQSDQLNEAENLLDDEANGKGPEDFSSGPSVNE